MPNSVERKYANVGLTRREISAAAKAGFEWAIELKRQVREADAWIKLEEEWAIKWVSSTNWKSKEKVNHCPICLREVWLHDIDRLIQCGEKWRERQACEHDWAYDYMGGDVCRKCGKCI